MPAIDAGNVDATAGSGVRAMAATVSRIDGRTNGFDPVVSSQSSTPNENMSLR